MLGGKSTQWAPNRSPRPRAGESTASKHGAPPVGAAAVRLAVPLVRPQAAEAGPITTQVTPQSLPLGPLPHPHGPSHAKHSSTGKRAHGAVFNGTRSPVRPAPSSPPPGSPLCADGHRTGRGPGSPSPVRSRRLTTSSVPLGLCSELCPSPNLRGWTRSGQKFDTGSCSLLLSRPTELQVPDSERADECVVGWFTDCNIGSPIAA